MLREPLRSPTPKKPVPKIAEFAANRKIAFFSAETHNASNPASHVTVHSEATPGHGRIAFINLDCEKQGNHKPKACVN